MDAGGLDQGRPGLYDMACVASSLRAGNGQQNLTVIRVPARPNLAFP
jgi:hypothetical protein